MTLKCADAAAATSHVMQRKLLARLALFFFVAIIGCIVVDWCITPRQRVTRQMHDQIRAGMSLQEVEAILGFPPGYYAAGPIWLEWGSSWLRFDDAPQPPSERFWITPSGAILVALNAEGLVAGTSYHQVKSIGIADRIRLWLAE